MGIMASDIWDKPPHQHNHPPAAWPASGIKPEGECPRCDEWHRWHRGTEENATPATVIESGGKKRGRPRRG